jgi:hypothetical protein
MQLNRALELPDDTAVHDAMSRRRRAVTGFALVYTRFATEHIQKEKRKRKQNVH